MSGVGITITIGGSARTKLGEIVAAIGDKGTFFAAASEIMLDQTQQRFANEKDPEGKDWTPLSPVTVELRGGEDHPILQVSGELRKVYAAPEATRAVVRTLDLPYAAIHQEGGKAGRGRKVFIPARPYFGFRDNDVEELTELAEGMIFDLE